MLNVVLQTEECTAGQVRRTSGRHNSIGSMLIVGVTTMAENSKLLLFCNCEGASAEFFMPYRALHCGYGGPNCFHQERGK